MVVAVLPFQNVSGNKDLDYFAIGFTEDIISDLSKFNNLQIISHYSTQIYSRETPSIEITSKLEADFLVCGSFRLTEEKIRIGIQLISAETNTVTWAEKYDQDISNIFALQDEITNHIVSSVNKNIDKNILISSRMKLNSNLKAYDFWLKGYDILKRGTTDCDKQARHYFEQALVIDPCYARAYTGISLSYFNEWSCQLWEKWEENQNGAFENAQKAVTLDEYDAVSLAVLGRIYLYKGEFEKGESCARKSLQLNPNDADNLTQIAASLTFLGHAAEAEKLYQKALKLNPLNHDWYIGIGLFINFELGNIDKSIELSEKVSFDESWIDISAFIAGAYFCKGDLTKAMFFWQKFEETFANEIAKDKPFTVDDLIKWFFYANPYKTDTRLSSLFNHITKSNFEPRGATIAITDSARYYLKRSGDLCELCFEGKKITLPKVKGFIDLAVLLNQPFTEIHCTQLMGANVKLDDNYFVLDDKARKEYQKKIRELLCEIAEAEEYSDFARAAKLKQEYAEVVDFLTKALGKGGNNRKLNSPTDKIRSAITWRIRSAIKKVEKHHPGLAQHLANSIQTGIFCSYSPEKNIEWEIS